MLIITLILILCTGDRTDYFLKPGFNCPGALYLISGLIVSVALFMIFLVFDRKKKDQNANVKHGYPIIAVLSVLLFAAEILFTFSAFFYSDWDPAGVLDCVYKLLRGNIQDISLDYFSAHPNNLMLVFIYLWVLRLASVFGTESVLSLMVFQSFLFTIGGVLFFFIVKDLLSERAAIYAWMIYAVWIGLNPYLLITYSDAAGLIFPLIIIRLFQFMDDLSGRRAGGHSSFIPLSMGIISAAGYMVKPQTVIAFIAVYIVIICISLLRKDPGKLRYLIFLTAGFLLSYLVIVNIFFPSLKLDLEKDKSFGFTHYIMMGLNPETDGVYSNEDTEFTNALKDPAERKSENLRVTKERLKEYGIKGFAGHILRKQLINCNDGTFSWGIDGNFFAGASLGDMPEVKEDSPLRPFILSFIDTNGARYGRFKDIMQVIWLTVLFFGAVGEIFMLKGIRKKKPEGNPAFQTMAVILLSLYGLILFELIFEAKARYLFTYLPLFLLSGVYGAVSSLRALRHRLSLSEGSR